MAAAMLAWALYLVVAWFAPAHAPATVLDRVFSPIVSKTLRTVAAVALLLYVLFALAVASIAVRIATSPS
jgi:hypothetical protein